MFFTSTSRSIPSSRGFTLLELLLVLVVIAVGAVAAISTVVSSTQDQAKDETQRVFLQLQLLNDEALLSGQNYGLRIDEKQNRILLMALGEDGWEPMDIDGMANEITLPEDLMMSMTLGGDIWKNNDSLFLPGSLFDEEMFAEVESDAPPQPPQIFILSSGEITPFTLHILGNTDQVNDDNWRVIVGENGVIHRLEPGDEYEE
ncbi:type II secretion system minor pseudopilin GspH [Vibrio sp. WXL103]|uniref:type II secretion system minor pseudopilin GspH n=1 Tax=Vibrio sp. WXL103 TaxID=3450710 RepID=UPI003EC7DDDE